MNAIISLCHFCELHGPSVVFCTQTFRDLPDFTTLDDIEAGNILDQQQSDKQGKAEDPSVWKYGAVRLDQHASTRNMAGSEACVACRSFQHNQPGFISNDDAARVSYVSSQFPLQSELYLLVRHACIRSLSCEVCPGREGPIYFGDEARGHVLSHTFFVGDVQARGFKRWYSILILMKDKMLLLNSWPFIVRHLRQTIDRLQECAKKIYENEESKVSHRALRSAQSMASDNFRRQRAAGQPRSLAELTGDEGVWQRLHSSFTWLLKAGGIRLQERLVEGPPVCAFLADGANDTGIAMSVKDFYSAVGSASFHTIYHNLLIGHQVVFRGSAEDIISAIVRSLKPLLPKHCFKSVEFSTQYVESSACNVLGLHSLAEIPVAVTNSENICVMEVFSKESNKEKEDLVGAGGKVPVTYGSKDGENGQRCGTELEQLLKNFSFVMLKEGLLHPRPPQILARIESAIANSTLNQATFNIYLTSAIYEWLNKVKVWRHVDGRRAIMQRHSDTSQQIPNETPASPRNPMLPGLRSPSHSLNRTQPMQPTRSFSPTSMGSGQGETGHHHDDLHQLLSAIGSTEWDIPLLKFWTQNFPS